MKSKLAVILLSCAALAGQTGFVFAAPSDYSNIRATQYAEDDMSKDDAMWYRSSQGVPCCD
ncbi:MAG: hypothetical protein HY661_09660 [Betaproteobacteria bacterium]|nr:hypothetical protein [Betaproteobacteria bacterium]